LAWVKFKDICNRSRNLLWEARFGRTQYSPKSFIKIEENFNQKPVESLSVLSNKDHDVRRAAVFTLNDFGQFKKIQ
jgi:hypothetical protein